MGLFSSKKQTAKNASGAVDDQEHFFDETFREELRNHGRWYFEKVITENGELFKKDLDATITSVNSELKEHISSQLSTAVTQIHTEIKEHITKQLDEQVVEYSKAMKGAQEVALQSIISSAQALQKQHLELSETIRKNLTQQEAIATTALEESKTQMSALKNAHNSALEWLNQTTKAMEDQHRQLSATLEKDITAQRELLVKVFEENMAQIVEQYLLGALGDQYDLKAQVPSIIRQLEANKQAIVDDMKL